jgi:hypothetical protein
MTKQGTLLQRIAAARESGEPVVLRLPDGHQLIGQIAALESRRVKLKTDGAVEWIPIDDIVEMENPGV